ncbi:MAG TPA: LarC family nickel insertion protein [Actinomycetota bacterium]|jgi:hypothetical protein
MRLAYFDCFSGISGNMALSALVHAGADLDRIGAALDRLPTIGFVLDREEVDVNGTAATRVHVKVVPEGVIRTFASIRSMLDEADLPERARWNAQRIFHRMASADAKVHNREPEVATFHDAAGDDTIVDVLGCTLAIDLLGIDRVVASPLPIGVGMARTDHGLMPVPSPLVMEILQGVPTYSRGIPVELATPTGAAIVASLAEDFGDQPAIRAEAIGYGAGPSRPDYPNLLRVVIGDEHRTAAGATTDPDGDALIQTTLRGTDPQSSTVAAHLDALRAAGASRAWAAPAIELGGMVTTVCAVAPSPASASVVACMRAAPGATEVLISPVRRAPAD